MKLPIGISHFGKLVRRGKEYMKLPIGISHFRELRQQDDGQQQYLFVDKTLFIKDFLDDGAKVTLITRPRRFGKTLAVSMLQHFFAPQVDEQATKGLFKGLEIDKADGNYVGKHQGKYPVIFLTLKDVKESNFADACTSLKRLIVRLYAQHEELLSNRKLTDTQKQQFVSTLSGQIGNVELKDSLRHLSECLHRYYETKPFIFIDEYDTPIQWSHSKGYYDDMIEFMRGFFGGLKDNPHLNRALLTGVLRISRESLFSDLNNLLTVSVLNHKYGQYFGFTEPEVEQLFTTLNLNTSLPEVKQWFNGYQIGEHILYNPWSIIRCLAEKGELQPYWVNTSENKLIRDLLARSDANVKEEFQQLLEGKTIEQAINANMNYHDLIHTNMGIWTLLLMSGYLTAVSVQLTDSHPICRLAVPNHEVMGFYRSSIKLWLTGGDSVLEKDSFVIALITGDMDRFSRLLSHFMEQVVSVHDVRRDTQENFYHGLLLGATVFLNQDTYEIQSNRESGYGRFDIAIIPKDNKQLAVIVEMKAIDDSDEKTLDKEARKALKQINDKAYMAQFKQRDIQHILKVGVAFSGKHFHIADNRKELGLPI